MDSISKLAQLRVKRSNKSEKQLREEYAEQTVQSPYEELRLDDPYFEEKQKVRSKLRPFYNRLKEKQS